MLENDEALSEISNSRINSKYLALIDNKSNGFVDHEDTRTELKFEKDAQSLAEFEKRKIIEITLERPANLDTWRNLSIGEYGLVEDDLRKKVWPLLLEVDPDENNEKIPTLLELSDHDEYNQVVLDVNRSLSRFPPGIPLKQRLALQDQLTVLILRVIMKYPHLKYYQGYHDVAITFLLVVGEVIAFRIMERLSTDHLKECMEPTMEKTSFRLNYMYPLLHRIDAKLHDFLEMSSVGTMFALPWYLTWFGHSLNRYKDVVRLYDFFLASPPLMPIYVATALVVDRRDEIFKQDCDLASIHCLLAQIPDDIDFEKILKKASLYYQRYKPEDLEKDVIKRVRREQDQRKRHEDRMRRLRRGNNNMWLRISNSMPPWLLINHRSRYGFLFATATVLIGLYAYYLKSINPNVNYLSHIWDT